MIFNTHYAYGGGAKNQAVIVVTAPTGSTVTATLEGNVLTAQEINGTWTFRVRKFGTYTVTATRGSETASKQVDVTEATTYNVTLAYGVDVTMVRNGAYDPTANTYAYALIDGVRRYEGGVYKAPIGSTIHCEVRTNNNRSIILLNGVIADSASSRNVASYDYIVTKPITITVQLYGASSVNRILIEE